MSCACRILSKIYVMVVDTPIVVLGEFCRNWRKLFLARTFRSSMSGSTLRELCLSDFIKNFVNGWGHSRGCFARVFLKSEKMVLGMNFLARHVRSPFRELCLSDFVKILSDG